MSRISKEEHFSDMATLTSKRASCARRQVGAVLVDELGHVLSTGYNGPASGRPHCTDTPCPGAGCASGTGLDLCEAIHAEQNALLQCANVYRIHTAYVTTAPCIHCIKLLMNTSCQRIIFRESYPHMDASISLWKSVGRNIQTLDEVLTGQKAISSSTP